MNFRGDTFVRNYSVEVEGRDYEFELGDILRLAFVDMTETKKLTQEIMLPVGETSVDTIWTAEEMATLEVGDYILEAEITTNAWTITSQEKITILRDYIITAGE